MSSREERLERAEAGDLGDDLLDEAQALVARHGEAVGGEHPVDDAGDATVELVAVHRAEQLVGRGDHVALEGVPHFAELLLAADRRRPSDTLVRDGRHGFGGLALGRLLRPFDSPDQGQDRASPWSLRA